MIVKGVPRQRQVIFEGNSLQANTNLAYANYLPMGVYSILIAAGHKLVYSCYAIGGKSQPVINATINTHYIPFLREGDIVFLWEGTVSLNLKTAAECIVDLQTFISAIVPTGAQLIIGTVIAKDQAGAPADAQQRLQDYNLWVRNNTNLGYTVCDLGAEPNFNEMSDASNLTYYDADKLHTTNAGKDLQMPVIANSITSLL